MTSCLIRETEIQGRTCRVRLRDGRIETIDPGLEPEPGEVVVQAGGGALLPGLRDHHIHLLALAAARESLACGPPQVSDRQGLERALRHAPRTELSSPSDSTSWIRGVGYHESVAGNLDRDALDALMSARPVRIQHRSGALWILNSRALEQLNLAAGQPLPPGAEKDSQGRLTGRLYREDAWLRKKLGERPLPNLAAVGKELARLGVTGVCDATPTNGSAELRLFGRARANGELPQRLLLMGGRELPLPRHERVERGAVKRMLDENDLPSEEELVEEIRAAHFEQRGVAFHCVTRTELLVALAALDRAGTTPLDRIEHASVTPPDILEWLSRLGVAVVTQPNFVFERGDVYRQAVETRDQPWLYRCAGFVEAGVPLAAGTDAPFGQPDPWAAMRAAVERRSAAGVEMGSAEALSPEAALDLFLSPLGAPGRGPSPIQPGAPADLILLE
ncbi:MAG: amidohydrolase family protein, partial [Myxococcota bacterium]